MANPLDIIEVVAETVYLGQKLNNIYHLVSDATVSDDDLLADVAEVIDSAYQLLASFLNGNLAPGLMHFINVTKDTIMGDKEFDTFLGGLGSSVDATPPGIAALVVQPTEHRGVRGRKFIGGLDEDAIETGVLSTGMVAAMLDFAEVISTPFNGTASEEDFAFGIIKKNGAFEPFSGFSASNIPAYQRRRKQGVGV